VLAQLDKQLVVLVVCERLAALLGLPLALGQHLARGHAACRTRRISRRGHRRCGLTHRHGGAGHTDGRKIASGRLAGMQDDFRPALVARVKMRVTIGCVLQW
jgi:hypothetical protein